MLVTAGAASAVLCVLAARRMGVADAEGHPIHLIGRFVTYLPWLLREIAKSAWAVAKIIVNPALPISPTMTQVRAGQKTPLGIVTYANSITLTPGTITDGRQEARADRARARARGRRSISQPARWTRASPAFEGRA